MAWTSRSPTSARIPRSGRRGYIFAYQDVRGRWMSEGVFVNMRPIKVDLEKDAVDELTDTYDTIDWLVKNIPNNNGKVGQSGISYPGFYTACGLVGAHPALKAASPQAPVLDWFVGDDFHHNGALFLPHAFNFLANFGHPRPYPTTKAGAPFEHGTPDGYDFFLKLGPLPNADARYYKGDVPFWDEMMQHGTYDAYWKARNLRPHLKDVKPAVMTVGGWFDAENLFGALECYKNIEATSPGISNTLVMGPWYHGQWGGRGNPGEQPRPRQVRRQDLRLLPRVDRVPLLRAPPQGGSRPQAARGVRLPDRLEPVEEARRLAPEDGPDLDSLVLQSDGKLGFDAPARSDDEGVRRVRQRPDQAGPLEPEHRHRDDPRVHG